MAIITFFYLIHINNLQEKHYLSRLLVILQYSFDCTKRMFVWKLQRKNIGFLIKNMYNEFDTHFVRKEEKHYVNFT